MSSLSPTHEPAEVGAPGASEESLPSRRAAELMRDARDGDRGAFGQLVVMYQDRLFNALLRLVGDRDEALELTQETFTRALGNLAGFRGESGPYTWFFRIATNLAISNLRKLQRHRVFSLDRPGVNGHGRGDDQAAGLLDRLTQDPSDRPEQLASQREMHERILAAMGRLDSEYRALLVMRDIEGFDYKQMAEILNLPLGTLKSRLFRARLALRDEVKVK
jgi:RNA polymerase sigma-70 factor (ECF subfamily)